MDFFCIFVLMYHQSLFDLKVAAKFELYNSLFLRLPFNQVKKSGTMLPVFTDFCHSKLQDGLGPLKIIESFFDRVEDVKNDKQIIDRLFDFLRFVERQVVLFDALEDAAYGELHDIYGPGSLKDVLNQIESNEFEDKYKKLLESFNVRVVLTAHPTQFYTPQVLGILDDLVEQMKGNDLAKINDLLLQMGKTPFKKKSKPSPVDEAEALIWILENVMYNIIPDLNFAFHRTVDGVKNLGQKPIVELGFWPGGDRDGNPFVDSRVTRQVAITLHQKLVSLYLSEISVLKRRLTFEGIFESLLTIEDKLEITFNPLKEELLAARELDPSESSDLKFLSLKHNGYHRPQELIGDLMELRQQLLANHDGLFLNDLDKFISKVQTFGFHFAILDIRQDSRIHGQALEAIWDKLKSFSGNFQKFKSYLDLSETKKIEALLQLLPNIEQLSSKEKKALLDVCLGELSDPVHKDCFESIQALQWVQELNGPSSCERYIISNFKGISDLLTVWLFATMCGLKKNSFNIDIVPLFESIEDLKKSHKIMDELYNIASYRKYLKSRNDRQYIMLGFSDGTKDGGYLTANWEILSAKQRLTEVANTHGLEAAFFDGRGGPPARGGGKTHKFYRSLGSKVNSHYIHITIQGQTITSNFGTPISARHNFEQLATAGIENELFPLGSSELEKTETRLIQQLSNIAFEHYSNLKHDPLFIEYLEEVTPLAYYGDANIASRPTKRKAEGKLQLGHLRAIPFVGSWSQMKQNVPGYFGLGTALKTLGEKGKLEELKKLYQHSLFFKTLLDNSMQSLSKTNFELTQYLAKDKKFGKFWSQLKTEANLTEEWLKKVSGHDSLMGYDRNNQKSIELRESLTLPVAVIQQYALQKIRALKKDSSKNQKEITVLGKMVIKSMAACVNAMRNSV